jgi:hypothetical protein
MTKAKLLAENDLLKRAIRRTNEGGYNCEWRRAILRLCDGKATDRDYRQELFGDTETK